MAFLVHSTRGPGIDTRRLPGEIGKKLYCRAHKPGWEIQDMDCQATSGSSCIPTTEQAHIELQI